VRHAIDTEDKSMLMHSLTICEFLRGVFDDFHAKAAEIRGAPLAWM
jgi:hypothetical protein